MTDARAYIDASEILQIVVANIRDGEKLGAHGTRFSRLIAARVRQRLAAKIADGLYSATPSGDDIVTVLEDICFGLAVPVPGGFPERPGSKFLCRYERDCVPSDVWYSSVVTLEYFEKLVPNAAWRAFFGPLADKTGNPAHDPLVMSQLTPDWRCTFSVDADFSFGNPIAWFTPRQELRRAIDGSPSLADAARDRLGLVHRKEPTHLVSLHFPSEILARKRSGRPTFADAGRHARFMLAPVNSPPTHPIQWGQTLALDLFALNAELSDGAKERVFMKVTAADLAGASLQATYLGALTETRGLRSKSTTPFAGTDKDFARLQVARDPAQFDYVAAAL